MVRDLRLNIQLFCYSERHLGKKRGECGYGKGEKGKHEEEKKDRKGYNRKNIGIIEVTPMKKQRNMQERDGIDMS